MYSSFWIIAFVFPFRIKCYENLCRNPTTSVMQSSTFRSNNATLVVDGIRRFTEDYCAHTDLNRTKAWLQVDFGQPYSIRSVRIVYRRERLDAWKQFRFRQFYLDVSEFPASTSNTSQRTRCYTDNTTYPYLPPNIITIPCKHTARYVIVETTYDAPEDDPVAGAILEICELEVYGCGLGRYGDQCTECPECSTCDIESGKCECSAKCKRNVCDSKGHCTDGCLDGFWTPNCHSSCPAYCKERNCIQNTGYCISCKTGYWGYTCTFVCSSHCLDGVCDIINGSCTHECTQGWYGDTCDNACSPGCVGGTCDKHSGTCNAGCKQNLTGHQCDVCDATHYGPACSLGCSFNCLNNTCDNITGSCILTGDCQVGKFGEMCGNICSKYCRNGCLKVTGICRDGCNVGKFGEFCNETCDARHEACCNQDIRKYKQSYESNTESIVYAVIAVLCTSFVINVYTITWILRNNACKKRDVIPDKAKRDTEFIPTTGIYDVAEGNAGYQELDQLSVPSHYSQLPNPTNN